MSEQNSTQMNTELGQRSVNEGRMDAMKGQVDKKRVKRNETKQSMEQSILYNESVVR